MGHKCSRCLKFNKICRPRSNVKQPGVASQLSTPNLPCSSLRPDNVTNSEIHQPTGSKNQTIRSVLNTDFYAPMDNNVIQPSKPFERRRTSPHNNHLLLSERMGYNSKTQRAEYMKARTIARLAAQPLRLDKAWKRYSSAEKHRAIKSVFESFHFRFLFDSCPKNWFLRIPRQHCEQLLRNICQNNVKNNNRREKEYSKSSNARSDANAVVPFAVHGHHSVSESNDSPRVDHKLGVTYDVLGNFGASSGTDTKR